MKQRMKDGEGINIERSTFKGGGEAKGDDDNGARFPRKRGVDGKAKRRQVAAVQRSRRH